ITESYDRGWKRIAFKMEEAMAGMREENARWDVELAKSYRNMSIHLYVVGFGILFVIISIGGTIIIRLV
ncbi:MAG: hypothetical protein OXF46_00375, partial [Rhodobacteraceae bacterium]|nr:hypothetical protein [Paracoccaceae bacterium]